jgi:hypothetical protein
VSSSSPTQEPPDPKAEGRVERTAALLRPWYRRWLADRQASLGVDTSDVGSDDDPVEPLVRQSA